MKKVFVAAAIFSLFAISIFAQSKKAGRGGQTLFEPRHWIYDALQILEQESAIIQFSDQAPISINQVRAMLTEIDYDALSEAGKIQYDRILNHFAESDFSVNASIFQARAAPEFTLEGYVKTNDNVPWVYDRYEKKSLIFFPITLGVGDWATLYADASIGLNKTAREDKGGGVNIPTGERNFDVNIPHTPYGSVGYAFTDTVGFNLRVGNMPESFGRAETGSVIQSGYVADATTAAFSVYSPIAQYSANITQLNTRRYVYAHKVDARIARKFQISMMEAALPYGDMDLRFFNPMMFLHNYCSWLDYQADGSDVGSYLGLKVNASPCKYLRIYALWSMTQFQLPSELTEDETDIDNYVPNAMGYQTGIESYIPIKKGHLHLNLEAYYAEPFFLINSSPNWSFVKTSGESNSGASDFYEWFGTRYGPDTLAASFKAEYEVPEKWSAGIKYLFLARGELSDPSIFRNIGWGPRILNLGDNALGNWVYPYVTLSDGTKKFTKNKTGRNYVAPTGIVEYANVISIYGSYQPLRWLKFYAQPSLAIVFNAGHAKSGAEISFECVVGAQVKFTKLKKDKKVLEEKNVVEATKSE